MNFNFWKRRDEDLDEELRFHLAMAIRDRVARGEDPKEAERAARREFGNMLLVRETTRRMWGWGWLEDAWHDARYALRGLRRSPGFTAAAVASLALGIGANTAIFSLTYTIMLRSLPVAHPEQLVELMQKYPDEPRGNGYWTRRSYDHYRERNQSFAALFGMRIDNHIKVSVEGGEPEFRVAEFVTENYFGALGLRPALGRGIGPGDEGTAVISWTLWTSRYHGDTGVLGKPIAVGKKTLTIIGVAPRGYRGPRVEARTDVWKPADPDDTLHLIGRLRDGATLAQARAEMESLYPFTIEERAAKSSDPLVRQLRVELEPCGAGLSTVRDRFGRPLTMLMAVVGVLLLLACANMAGLLLARGAARGKEMAMRLALGASRWRLARQVLTESLLLSVAGTAAGGVVAYGCTQALVELLASGRPREKLDLAVELDAQLLLYAAGLAAVTGLLFGLAPAWSALRVNRKPGLAGKGLVAAQVALSVLLLSSAGLFLAQLGDLKQADLGFRRDHVLLADLDPSRSVLSRDRLPAGYAEILRRAEAIPGVRSATMGAPTPLHGAGASGFAAVDGFPEREADRRRVSVGYVAPRYFATLDTPLFRGREFTMGDATNPNVAIISSRLAEHYFKGLDPIGRSVTMSQVTMARDPVTYQVIGVVGDSAYFEIRGEKPRTIYFPAFRSQRMIVHNLILRTDVDPESVGEAVRRAVGEAAPGVVVEKLTTLEAQIDSSIVLERLMAMLSGFFGVLGAVLAGIGVYGLLAYMVARRTSEIGVRMALGATGGRVIGMILRDAMAVILAGLVAGIPLAIWGRRVAVALVPELGSYALGPLAAGAAAIALVALAAAFVPARRAARVDPMVALWQE